MVHVESVLQPFATSAIKDVRVGGQEGLFSSDLGMEDLLRIAGFTNLRMLRDQIFIRFISLDHWY